MTFNILKNATLPLLKLQVVKDGRSDFNKFMAMIEQSSIFFSMINTETGIPKITSRPAGFVEKTFLDPNAEPEYYIYYQFTSRDTNTPGRYQGEFLLRNSDGVLIIPIREQLFIDIQDSFIADDLEYTSCYVSEFPCCVNGPFNPTPIPTECCPCVTPTPSTTPTPTPVPPNDFTYLLIPDGGLSYVYITGATITLESEVTPGSVIVNYILTSNEVLPSGFTLNFIQSLGLVTGGTLNITTSCTIMPGDFSGSSLVIKNEYNFDDLDGTSSFSGVSYSPSGSTISSIIENTTFITPPPPILVSITVTPPNPVVLLSNTLQLIATGLYSDASSQDITTICNWSSSDSGIASVDDVISKGLVTGNNYGMATISASLGFVNGSTNVNVA